MEEKMSRWGVGPAFAALSIGYGLITLTISYYFHPGFQIEFLPYRLLSILGIALILIGLPFFIISARTVSRAYNSDKLVTDGIFRCCRHLLYGSWVVFIVPGIALLLKSWIVMSTSLFMYFLLRKLVKKEEVYLEHVFGSDYREYQRRIPCVFPFGWLKRPYNTTISADSRSRADD
ncbi:MAG: isoprenylcysteine carboxylmethyltransferase family protein [Deltaproteobacteria bacterium]|nr:isoprenylcysteine carboxylmethyltransferase family protein [Deltaproteobacteria bacterium]